MLCVFCFPNTYTVTQVHCTEGVERRRSFHFCCCCLFLFSLLMLLILLPLLLLLLSMLLNSLCNTFGVPGFEPETRATADRCAANELHACLFPTVISAIFFFFYKVKKPPKKTKFMQTRLNSKHQGKIVEEILNSTDNKVKVYKYRNTGMYV